MRRGSWLAFVSAVATAVVVGVFTAGSASAATSVFCTDSASDQTTLQNAINGGGTVLVHGHCLGNWEVFNNVTLTGVGGAVLDGGSAGPVLVIEAPLVTINTLTIENGNSDEGGGILTADSTVNVNNSTITNNVAEVGGGIFVEFGFVNLTGTTVSHNTAFEGGGILAVEDGELSATNSSIVNNTATEEGEGGGIFAEFSDVALTGTRVLSNSAGLGGGILDVGAGVEDTVVPAGTTVAGVTVPAIPKPSLSGGRAASAAAMPKVRPAVAPVFGSGLTLTNSSIDHNTAAFAGGGIVNIAEGIDSPVTLVSSSVSYNQALSSSQAPGIIGGGGGGIFNLAAEDTVASVTATGSQIRGNLARTSSGGGILNAAEGGSALVSLASTSLSPQSHTLNPNRAQFGAGIYSSGDGADITVGAGASIVRNIATVDGGGIFSECDGTISVLPGAVIMLNNPNNIVNDPTSCDD